MRYFLLIAVLLSVACWADAPPVSPEQAAKVQAILATITEYDATLRAAVEALVKEGQAILPALQTAPVVDTGELNVPVLTRQQAIAVREAFTWLRWGFNPRTILQPVVDQRIAKQKTTPTLRVFQHLTPVTDHAVMTAFPDALFYVANWGEGATFVVMWSEREVYAVQRDRTVQPLPDKAALEAYVKANAPVLPKPEPPPQAGGLTIEPLGGGKPRLGGGKIQEIPSSAEVRATAYSWVRLYALVVYGARLKIDPNINVRMETAMTNAIGAKPHSWLTGPVTATPPPASGLTGNDLSGTLSATVSFDVESRKLVGITTVDKLTHVPVA